MNLNYVIIKNTFKKLELAKDPYGQLRTYQYEGEMHFVLKAETGEHFSPKTLEVAVHKSMIEELERLAIVKQEHHDYQLIVSVDNGFRKTSTTKERTFDLDGFCFILRHVVLESPISRPTLEGVLCNVDYNGLHKKANDEIIDTGKHFRFSLQGTTRHPICPMIPKEYYIRHILNREDELKGESISLECEIVERNGFDTVIYDENFPGFQYKKIEKSRVDKKYRRKKYNYEIIVTKVLTRAKEQEIFDDYKLEELFEQFRVSKFYNRHCYEIELGEKERQNKENIKNAMSNTAGGFPTCVETCDENGELIFSNNIVQSSMAF